MHGHRESAMAPFNEGHLLSGGGIGVGYPVFIEINGCNLRVRFNRIRLVRIVATKTETAFNHGGATCR